MRTNTMMKYATLCIHFMKTNIIMKYFSLIAGLIVSAIWGIAWFRYISVPTFILFFISVITIPWHKKRKITYIALGFYLLTTVVPIDIRTSKLQYDAAIPAVNIVPLVKSSSYENMISGKVYLYGDLVTGLEPKWVLVWRTDIVHLWMNNIYSFIYYIKYAIPEK